MNSLKVSGGVKLMTVQYQILSPFTPPLSLHHCFCGCSPRMNRGASTALRTLRIFVESMLHVLTVVSKLYPYAHCTTPSFSLHLAHHVFAFLAYSPSFFLSLSLPPLLFLSSISSLPSPPPGWIGVDKNGCRNRGCCWNEKKVCVVVRSWQ